MRDQAFKLFPFQEEVASELRIASLLWMEQAVKIGPPKSGSTTIPFLGQLKAVTGSGKTPILASAIAGLGAGVVLWTSRSSAVVEQTFNNLGGKYRTLLPRRNIQVIRDISTPSVWRSLIDDKSGLTIWLLTVGSWNEAGAAAGRGSEEARLNLHRPHPDWAGRRSPWDQLRTDLKRPLWIVSDESHNQSTVQLDQLADLKPKGFFMASATPMENDLFRRWADTLDADENWRAMHKKSLVAVKTRDVVEAELLKTTIEFIDFNSGTEESLDGVLDAMGKLQRSVKSERVGITPRAIYVVQQSNPKKGSVEEARPVVIWKYLRSKRVPANEIAVYTDTRLLPADAERISALSQLQPRHKHIIFNQSLQEGWDDPEAYVCYFDGVTKSFVRIRQIVGRVLRQPHARRCSGERLNTATIILNTPAGSYDTVVQELREELRLYAPADEPDFVPIKVKTRKDPLIPIKPKGTIKKRKLPRYAVKAPDMAPQIRNIKGDADRKFRQIDLEAAGLGKLKIISLETEKKEREQILDVIRSARTENGIYLRRQIQQLNRACSNALHPDIFIGEAYQQLSCQGSIAQQKLVKLAGEVADYYENRAEYEQDPDSDNSWWRVGEHRPRSRDMISFNWSGHSKYSRNDFNNDELEFANALDRMRKGIWIRNVAVPELGYGIPLPAKVGDSSTFYPDFLWWIGKQCWAIDTTGAHLISEKVRGKLFSLEKPKVAFAVRGRFDAHTNTVVSPDGWSLVIARPHIAQPSVNHGDDLNFLLKDLAKANGITHKNKVSKKTR